MPRWWPSSGKGLMCFMHINEPGGRGQVALQQVDLYCCMYLCVNFWLSNYASYKDILQFFQNLFAEIGLAIS